MGYIYIDVYTDGRNKCSENQVPEIAKKYLAKFEGCFEKTWSTELVEILVEAAQKEEDYSPLDYPFCVQDYYTALKNYPVEGKRVFTSEYNIISNLISLDPRIKIVHAQHLMHYHKFDAISSYSSIEHDGLGRYGDPINPNGDFSDEWISLFIKS